MITLSPIFGMAHSVILLYGLFLLVIFLNVVRYSVVYYFCFRADTILFDKQINSISSTFLRALPGNHVNGSTVMILKPLCLLISVFTENFGFQDFMKIQILLEFHGIPNGIPIPFQVHPRFEFSSLHQAAAFPSSC